VPLADAVVTIIAVVACAKLAWFIRAHCRRINAPPSLRWTTTNSVARPPVDDVAVAKGLRHGRTRSGPVPWNQLSQSERDEFAADGVQIDTGMYCEEKHPNLVTRLVEKCFGDLQVENH
jgi:hypothetical protein